jgi:endonuclease YncB( thermonuclease family)
VRSLSRASRGVLGAAAAAASAALLVGAAVVPAGAAATYTWYGKATKIVDGDTVYVDIWGDGTATPVELRLNGLDTMETGTCNAAAGKAALASLIPLGSKVRVEANNKSAIAPDGVGTQRPLRVIYNHAGVDVQKAILDRGLALPYPFPQDPMNQSTYFYAAQKAAASGLEMFDPATPCKTGPQQDAQLRVWVSWDGDGDERYAVNGEWIRVLNEGSSPVSLGGWWLRTSSHTRFTFPAGTTVDPGAYVTLHVGKGTATSSRFYWGYTAPIFPNTGQATLIGNGGYLFDPDGDLRAWSIYPCLYDCTSPLIGKVRIFADYDPKGDESTNPNLESVQLTNATQSRIDLSHQVVQVGGSTYEIALDSYLDPGERLTVRIGKGTQSRLTQYWGRTSSLLVNAGGTATLRTTENVRIVCTAWGSGRC